MAFKSDILTQQARTVKEDKSIGSILLVPREFSSGKIGFGASQALQQLVGGESVRMQASINLVMAHSDGLPAAEKAADLAALKTASAKELVGHVVLKPRTFSSGKVGFGASEAVTLEVNGQQKRFQLSLNITAAHSEGWEDQRPASPEATA